VVPAAVSVSHGEDSKNMSSTDVQGENENLRAPSVLDSLLRS